MYFVTKNIDKQPGFEVTITCDMNRSCPETASPPPLYQLEAATSVLRDHRIDCHAAGRCFTLPAKAIQQAVRVAGSEARPLLRTGALRPLIHEGDLRSPWLELLAIFAIDTGVAPTVVIALGASSPRVVEHLIKPRLGEPDRALAGHSEKMRLLNQVAELAGKYERAARTGAICAPVRPERILHNLETTMDSLQSRTNDRRHADAAVASATNSSVFLVCGASGVRGVEALFATAEIPIVQVDSVRGFMAETLPNWRAVLGTGWLTRIDCLERSMRRALGSKAIPGLVRAELIDGTGRKPAELAVSAAAKFTAFGWLPQHWSAASLTRTKFKVGHFVKTLGGAMTDGDISVFKLPRIVFPGEEELRIRTPEERLESSWTQFQTPFAEDEVFLFCDHSAHGERADGEIDFPQIETVARQLMPLGFLHPTSLGVLRCLFPSLRIDMIGYSPAASTTTRSAVLERILRLARDMADEPGVIEQLRKEVVALRNPEQLGCPQNPSHARCIELECQLQAMRGGARSFGGAGTGAFPSSWPRKLLGTLLGAGRSGQGPAADVFSVVIRLASLLLRVAPDKLGALILGGDAGAIKELRLVRALAEIISAAAAGDSDVKRTKGTRFGHLALRKELGLMVREAVKGRLAAPPLLAEWITRQVRLTCVMPLDPLAPPQSPRPVEVRPLPCAFGSYRNYRKLFSPDPAGPSIAADVTRLLEHAMRALDPGDGTRAPGWLANKISQANELTAAMMVRTGHVEDFPYGDLLSSKTPRNTRAMLAALPSQILVRCILLDEPGRELLKQWCASLCEEVSGHWRKEIEGIGESGGGLSSEARSLLDVFRDAEGMAAAALDCCRNSLLTQAIRKPGPSDLRVYFLPEELVNNFRTPVLMKSRGARSNDGIERSTLSTM